MNSHSENGVLTILDEGAGGVPVGVAGPQSKARPTVLLAPTSFFPVKF